MKLAIDPCIDAECAELFEFARSRAECQAVEDMPLLLVAVELARERGLAGSDTRRNSAARRSTTRGDKTRSDNDREPES